MRTYFGGLRGDFLSYERLLPDMFVQKKSILQTLAANMLIWISIVTIVCQYFLPWQENLPNALFLISNKDSKEKIDSMHVVEQDMTLNEICSSPIICNKTTGWPRKKYSCLAKRKMYNKGEISRNERFLNYQWANLDFDTLVLIFCCHFNKLRAFKVR